jgi:hypothetical protein
LLQHGRNPDPRPDPQSPRTYDQDADERTESLFYLAAGPGAAIALGIALAPLREITTASNLTFVFLALTIAVAELGGRRAAVATALCSALSLDFFLTRPYLRLTIEDKHDVIAFAGLAICGLIAASLGAPRRSAVAALRTAARERDLLRSLLAGWHPDARIEPPLSKVLRASRSVLALDAAVVRDGQDQVVASTAPADALRPIPARVAEPPTLLQAGSPDSRTIPPDGARIELMAGRRRIGWLDVWGSRAPAGGEARRALFDLSRLVTLVLAAEASGRADAEPDANARE